MRKICVVVTARPSYSRVRTALAALKAHPKIELQLVVAASALLDRYGRVADIMEADGFTINARVYSVLEGGEVVQSVKSVGLGLMELSTAFDMLQPDAVVTIADRYETIATAIAASYTNIPLIHIQGGEFTGSIDNKVRHAVTKLADVHLVASEQARQRVISMGEDPDFVFMTGCPSIDIALDALSSAPSSFNPYVQYTGVGSRPDLSTGFLVVLQHPVTTEYRDAFAQAQETLTATLRCNMPVLWFWPNVDAGSDGTSKALRVFREQTPDAPFHFFKNMEPEDFLRLLRKCSCLVGNSSAGIREAAFLGVPVVNIGSRQQGRERGPNVVDVGHDIEAIAAAIEKQVSAGHYQSSHIYGDGSSGRRIADVIAQVPFVIEKRDFFGSAAHGATPGSLPRLAAVS